MRAAHAQSVSKLSVSAGVGCFIEEIKEIIFIFLLDIVAKWTRFADYLEFLFLVATPLISDAVRYLEHYFFFSYFMCERADHVF